MTEWTCDSCGTIWAEGQRFCRFCDDPNAKIRELEAKLAEAQDKYETAELWRRRYRDKLVADTYHSKSQPSSVPFSTALRDAAREEEG